MSAASKPTKDQVIKGLKDGKYILIPHVIKKTRKNHKPSDAWRSFKDVVEKKLDSADTYVHVGYVKCVFNGGCNALYSSKTGTQTLLGHRETHKKEEESPNQSLPLTNHVNLRKGHKQKIDKQCVQSICIDLDSFRWSRKRGNIEMLKLFWNLGAVYKRSVTSENIVQLLPSPQTVSRDILTEAAEITQNIKRIYSTIIANEFPPPIHCTTDMWSNILKHAEIFGLTGHHLPSGAVRTVTNWIGIGEFIRYYQEALRLRASEEKEEEKHEAEQEEKQEIKENEVDESAEEE